MTKKEREEISGIVAMAVAVAVEKELGAYKVPKEQHYKDHLWINQMLDYQDTIKNSFVKTVVGVIIAGFFSLMVYGFIFWGKNNIVH